MKKYTITLIIFALSINLLSAQTNIENILQEIETNNLHLKSLSEKQKAKEYEAKASLQLENPHLGGEYIVNSPTNGVKYGFELTQSFNFPSVYGKRKTLVNEQIKSFNIEYQQNKRELLFNAKNIVYEIIYKNKLISLLTNKEESLKKAFEKYQVLFDQKSATILDLSKAKLQFFKAKSEVENQKLALGNLLISLKELNAGKEISLADTIFSSAKETISFEEFKNDYLNNEMNLKLLEQSLLISEKKMKLSQNERLPKFELGYKYANEESFKFNGVVFGVSIPLWQGRKEVKASKINFVATEIELNAEKISAEREIEILYKNYTISKKLYEEYKNTFEGLTILESLNKQFELSNMTSYEYYWQLNDFYDFQVQVLEAEFTYYQSVLALEKYKL